MDRPAGPRPGGEAARIRDDELAEMELRILVALYDAWPAPLTVRSNAVFRPAARYTGPNDAPAIMQDLLAGRIDGRLGPVGLLGGKLRPTTLARLDEFDEGGRPWISRARAVMAEASRPVTGHAKAVRDGIRG